ncbi:MAG: hypothetical protein RLZZ304_149 [Actinomycetota bacterium]|jgi:drug/metabolite transporter (DMT)-like permease
MHLTDKTKGTALALLGTLLFGLNASTSKVVMAIGIMPGQLVGFRSMANAILAGLIVLFTRPQAFKVRWREIPALMAFGLIGVAIMQWAYSVSLQLLPVGIALLFEYTAIVWVPLVSYVIFKEKFKPRLWLGVVAVIAGLAVVSQIWAFSLNLVGVLAALLAAAGTTTYFIMGEHTQKDRDVFSTLFYTMLFSAAFWAALNPWWQIDLAKFAESVSLGGSLTEVEVPGWLILVWIGVAGSFLPMLFSYMAMRLLRPTLMGIISTAEVLYAFIFGFLWLGEKISGLQALGGVLVLAGIVIAQTARGDKWQPSN